MPQPLLPPDSLPAPADDDPRAWLASTPLLDLDDPKLRLKAQALTQLCKNEREKALAIYGLVKRLPFSKPFKMRLHTAREVLDLGRGDAPDKATLFVALLRLAGLPARLRYVLLRGEILRGLTTSMASASRPVVELWLGGGWVRTDTYIFDAAYMAAARQRLKDQGWDWGYGMNVAGQTLWNGTDSVYVGGMPTEEDPMVIADLGVFCDPLEFVSSPAYRSQHARVPRAIHWNMIAPVMDRAIRELREDAPATGAAATRRTS